MDKKIKIKNSTLTLHEEWPDDITDRLQEEKTDEELQDMSLQDFLMTVNQIEKDLHDEDQVIDDLIHK